MALKRICLIAALVVPAPAVAQDDWEYTATFYGWLTGLAATVDTPEGEVEAEVEFSDVLDSLDFAGFGAFEARNGRWSFLVDGMYADLTTDVDAPSGTLFKRGEVETQAALVGAYATYAVIDEKDLRVDVGSGVRYVDMTVDTQLVGQDPDPNASFSVDGSYADFLLAARAKYYITEKLFTVAYGDVGGFGIGDSSDLTWQGSIGLGYQISERWASRNGFRYLSMEREFNGVDVTTEVYGPFLGVQYSF